MIEGRIHVISLCRALGVEVIRQFDPTGDSMPTPSLQLKGAPTPIGMLDQLRYHLVVKAALADSLNAPPLAATILPPDVDNRVGCYFLTRPLGATTIADTIAGILEPLIVGAWLGQGLAPF